MPVLTAEQVASFAIQAGFRGQPLVIAVAVAHAESGFRSDIVGDKDLTEKGECSVGLWQINYRPSRDKPGGLRDPTLNLDPTHNAQAAYVISDQGRNFKPWSTFTNGDYGPYLALAANAVLALQAPSNTGGITVPTIVAAFPYQDGYVLVSSDGSVYCFNCQYHGGLQHNGTTWVVAGG